MVLAFLNSFRIFVGFKFEKLDKKLTDNFCGLEYVFSTTLLSVMTKMNPPHIS